jgi:hypothetical protein
VRGGAASAWQQLLLRQRLCLGSQQGPGHSEAQCCNRGWSGSMNGWACKPAGKQVTNLGLSGMPPSQATTQCCATCTGMAGTASGGTPTMRSCELRMGVRV